MIFVVVSTELTVYSADQKHAQLSKYFCFKISKK